MRDLILRLTPWERMVLQEILYTAIDKKVEAVMAEVKPEGVTDEEHAWFQGLYKALDEKVTNAFLEQK